MTDRERIVSLLGSLLDDLPLPRSCLSGVKVPGGPVPTTPVECPTCQGRGQRGHLRCDVCDGSGRLTVDPMTYFDPRTGKTRPREKFGVENQAEPRVMELWELDAALAALQRQVDGEEDMDAEDGLLTAIVRRDRSGSYAELERALGVLRTHDLRIWRVVTAVHVGHVVEAEHLTLQDRHRLEQGITLLGTLMPRPIRIPRHLQMQLVTGRAETRASAIVRLREEGVKVPEIVRRTGLSRSRVYEILAQADARKVEETNGEAA